jgi:hypothetical protein
VGKPLRRVRRRGPTQLARRRRLGEVPRRDRFNVEAAVRFRLLTPAPECAPERAYVAVMKKPRHEAAFAGAPSYASGRRAVLDWGAHDYRAAKKTPRKKGVGTRLRGAKGLTEDAPCRKRGQSNCVSRSRAALRRAEGAPMKKPRKQSDEPEGWAIYLMRAKGKAKG